MDDEDLFSEARLASRLVGRRNWETPDRPTGRQVIEMLTESGAALAGFAGRIGRIEPGWFADLTAISLDATRGVYLDPDMSLVEALVARGRGADVRLTMVGGRVLYRDGEFPHLDIAEIREGAGTAAGRAHLPDNRAYVDLTSRLRPYLADFYRRLTADTRFPDVLS
jgi:5-methylthioadenosine/S-adenosylhomocysteine deaminase